MTESRDKCDYSKDGCGYCAELVGEFGPFGAEMWQRLWKAYTEAAKHKRGTRDYAAFESNLHAQMLLLFYDIMHGSFKPGSGIAFVVEEPVLREVFAGPFRDRIIHHVLFDITAPWWEKRFIYDSYSCRKGKGTLMGVKRLAHYIRKVSQNYTREVWVAKFDLKGYFMSLPRAGLYKKVLAGLKRQFPSGGPLFEMSKYLWREVIFDDPVKGVKRRGNLELWDKLPKNKSLFNQPDGRGIVIGNLTSQLLSNIYLDEFDKYVRETLGFKSYGRYVDDFFIVVTKEDVPRLKRSVKFIRLKLESMGLTLHPNKFYFQEASKGVPFLGYVVYKDITVVDCRVRKKLYYALMEVTAGLRDPSSITSYLGLLKHSNSKNITAKIFAMAGQEYNM